MRLFLALEPSRKVQVRITHCLETFRKKYPDLKWVSSENYHLTLRFLGDMTPESVISELAFFNPSPMLPVEFTLTRSGTFGVPPSVLWLSGDFSEGVYTIADKLGALPDGNGRTGRMPFRPHISVARPGRDGSLPGADWRGRIHGVFHDVKLVSSVLTPQGPVYTTLKTWPA